MPTQRKDQILVIISLN